MAKSHSRNQTKWTHRFGYKVRELAHIYVILRTRARQKGGGSRLSLGPWLQTEYMSLNKAEWWKMILIICVVKASFD